MDRQRISVRNLVEFLLRSGDIDNRTAAGPDPEAMREGTRAHRRIQGSKPESYRAEVPLSRDYADDDLILTVEGRADGIDRRDGIVTVDEIKGVYLDVRKLAEPLPLHLAQVKCYAAILTAEEDLSEIHYQVTYYGFESGVTRIFPFTASAEEITAWMDELVRSYFRWAHDLDRHRKERNTGAAELTFPYPYRKGQKEAAASVYRSIRRGKNLFLQAPTGMGKTLSVVFPAVRAMGEGLTNRIFYLSAKGEAQSAALEAFKTLSECGVPLRVCRISAKEKSCLNETFDCSPDTCPYAKGHFDRVNEAVFDLLHRADILTEEQIAGCAKEHRVCPFELSLDASEWCDAVVADYNYAFDPRARLKRFFSEGADKDSIFLIDEAHNLVERAEDMYSAELKKEDVLALKRLLKGHGEKAVKALNSLNRSLLAMRRSLDDYPAVRSFRGQAAMLPDVGFLYSQLEQSVGAISEFLEDHRSFPERQEVMPLFFEIRTFFHTADLMNEKYRVLGVRDGENFSVRLLCVDPSEKLKECLAYCRTAVFFSATLLPVTFYKELLTGNPEEYAVYTESPFERKQRLLLAASDVTTRFDRRTRNEYEKIAAYISTALRVKPGNYLCFFPSYEILRQVEDLFRSTYGAEEITPFAFRLRERDGEFILLCQSTGMKQEEKKRFLEAFRTLDGTPRVGFCVLGGVFSEGIDLKRESLIGTIIVGTGLPAINAESEVRKQYFDEMGKSGFDYAYRFPGMNKVQQAAGRLIRTDEDRGVILLLDSRFLTRSYRTLFPKEWTDAESTDLTRVESQLESFWKQSDRISTH